MTKEGCMKTTYVLSIQKHVMKIGNYTLLVNVYKLSKIHLNTVKDSSTGTEVVNSQDHTVIALLGESPGFQLQFQLR